MFASPSPSFFARRKRKKFLELFEASLKISFARGQSEEEEEKKNFCDVSVIAKEKSFFCEAAL